MRKLLLGTAAVLGLAFSGGVAHAGLTYTIWTGDMSGDHSADPASVPGTTPLATFADPGNPINFVNNGADDANGSDNLFSEFFTAPVLAECNVANSACGNTIMSTTDNFVGDTSTPPDTSTFIEITGFTAEGGSTVTISHDDGGTIYEGSTEICGAPGEAADTSQTCTVPGSGPQNLTIYYTEDNGAPSILQVSAVPEPMTLTLFGSGLIGLGLARRRKNT